MRTTIDLNDELLREAKRRAVRERRSLRAVVEAALRAYVGRGPKPRAYHLKWRTERGRLQPGIRLDDRESLFDAMEGRS